MIPLKALKYLSLKAFVAGITNISFTKTVAVSLNEAGPFALRNSIMDDTEADGTFLSMHFQNSKLRFRASPVYRARRADFQVGGLMRTR